MSKDEKVSTFDVEAKQFDESSGDIRFEGWLARYGNKDADGDIIVQGAFSDSVRAIATARSPFPVLFQHSMAEQIGIFEDVTDRTEGVFVKGIIAGNVDTARGKVIPLMRRGWLNSMSVGFSVEKQRFDGEIRLIETGRMWEGSIVSIPANDEAAVTSVKQFKSVMDNFLSKGNAERLTSDDLRDLSLSEIEKRLANCKASRKAAKMLASGLSHLRDEDEASKKHRDGVEPDNSAVLKSIGDLAEQLKLIVTKG